MPFNAAHLIAGLASSSPSPRLCELLPLPSGGKDTYVGRLRKEMVDQLGLDGKGWWITWQARHGSFLHCCSGIVLVWFLCSSRLVLASSCVVLTRFSQGSRVSFFSIKTFTIKSY